MVIFDRSCGLHRPLDVCSSPKATCLLRGNEMMRRAISRLMRSSKTMRAVARLIRSPHAWACRVGGMARPSGLAVLRLMAFSMVATAETSSLIDVREDLSAMVFVARCQRSRLNVFVRAWPAPSPDGLVIKASQRMLSAGEQRETQHFDRSHSSSTFNDRSRTQFENSLLPVQVSISLFV